jgi:hypothetical protein
MWSCSMLRYNRLWRHAIISLKYIHYHGERITYIDPLVSWINLSRSGSLNIIALSS